MAEKKSPVDWPTPRSSARRTAIERTDGDGPSDPGDGRWHHAVRHLKRWPLGTGYPAVVGDVARLIRALAPVPRLVVDATGVGRPVVDAIRRADPPCRLIPVTITAGHAPAGGPDGGLHLPKRDLVSTLQVLLQERRLRVAAALPEAPTLVDELSRFQVKVTLAGNEAYGAWREGAHDDLVLAVALAAWVAECDAGEYAGPLVHWPVLPAAGADGGDRPGRGPHAVLEDLGIGVNGDW